MSNGAQILFFASISAIRLSLMYTILSNTIMEAANKNKTRHSLPVRPDHQLYKHNNNGYSQQYYQI